MKRLQIVKTVRPRRNFGCWWIISLSLTACLISLVLWILDILVNH